MQQPNRDRYQAIREACDQYILDRSIVNRNRVLISLWPRIMHLSRYYCRKDADDCCQWIAENCINILGKSGINDYCSYLLDVTRRLAKGFYTEDRLLCPSFKAQGSSYRKDLELYRVALSYWASYRPSSLEALSSSEIIAAIWELLARRLSKRDLMIARLCWGEGIAPIECAQILKVERKVVSDRLARIRKTHLKAVVQAGFKIEPYCRSQRDKRLIELHKSGVTPTQLRERFEMGSVSSVNSILRRAS